MISDGPNTGSHTANDAAGELKISKVAMVRRKQVYKITYPNGKIYVGMDLTGSLLYLGSPSASQQIAEDLDLDDHRFDLTLPKEILWESQTRYRCRGSGDGGEIDTRDRREQSCNWLQQIAPLPRDLTLVCSGSRHVTNM